MVELVEFHIAILRVLYIYVVLSRSLARPLVQPPAVTPIFLAIVFPLDVCVAACYAFCARCTEIFSINFCRVKSPDIRLYYLCYLKYVLG